MLSAFIAIPFSYLTFTLDSATGTEALIMQLCLQLFGTVLFVVITRFTKKLFKAMCGFHAVDQSLNLMIMANIASGILVMAGLLNPPLKETLSTAALICMVGGGIIQIRFGYTLLKLPFNLDGLLKPFCYTNIITGICLASVVLILAGVAFSAISDLMLGTIFLNLARHVKETERAMLKSDPDGSSGDIP